MESGKFIRGDGINTIYPALLAELGTQSPTVSPRGMPVAELLASGGEMYCRNRVTLIPERKFHIGFAAVEALWNLAGRSDVHTVASFISRMKEFSDDGETLRSCYGARLRGWADPTGHSPASTADQLYGVCATLDRDVDSRQAVVVYRFPGELDVIKTADQICGTAQQFFIRENELHSVFTIRSNDVWLGVPYDVFTFSLIQEVIAAILNFNPGQFIWVAGSLHLYERDFPKAEQLTRNMEILKTGTYPNRQWPCRIYLRGEKWAQRYRSFVRAMGAVDSLLADIVGLNLAELENITELGLQIEEYQDDLPDAFIDLLIAAIFDKALRDQKADGVKIGWDEFREIELILEAHLAGRIYRDCPSRTTLIQLMQNYWLYNLTDGETDQ